MVKVPASGGKVGMPGRLASTPDVVQVASRSCEGLVEGTLARAEGSRAYA
jgi:hypothetical protein